MQIGMKRLIMLQQFIIINDLRTGKCQYIQELIDNMFFKLFALEEKKIDYL